MAGETEDCISFQADHLPTGSISFGRFELESLSWERKSSFCHNRYLEEVEKFSKPGSVTQKRAILEAHFKKKPLFSQTSLETQNVTECRTIENGNRSCSNEFEDHENGTEPEFSWYDDSPSCSEGHEVMECEQGAVESMLYNDERVIETIDDNGDNEKKLQDQHLSKDDVGLVSEQEPDNKAVIMEELLENKEAIIVEELKTCVESKCPGVERKKLNTLKKKNQASSLKVKEATEQKFTKPKQRDLPAPRNLNKSTTERNHVPSGKMLSRSLGNQERESASSSKSMKQALTRTPIPRSSHSKNLKSEASENMKSKVRQGNMRSEVNVEKNVRAIKSSPRPHSNSGRSEGDAHQPLSRHQPLSSPKQNAYSSKEETRQSGTIFSLKSDERAEKRKEYYMKLEEKLQAKEVEMNEIQAKTQEETVAAIKQFRRSLNFKATPMPSFYHEAVPRTERKKKAAPQVKPSKTSLKEKFPSNSKASNRGSSSIKNSAAQKREKVVENSSEKKGETVHRMGRKMKDGVIGCKSVAVHVGS